MVGTSLSLPLLQAGDKEEVPEYESPGLRERYLAAGLGSISLGIRPKPAGRHPPTGPRLREGAGSGLRTPSPPPHPVQKFLHWASMKEISAVLC